jgi:hypothetical protein
MGRREFCTGWQEYSLDTGAPDAEKWKGGQ